MRRVGVVVARLQNDDIHVGHAMLIKYAKEQSDFVLLVLGEARTRFTVDNPLPFEARKIMVEQTFKKSFKYKTLKLVDCKYDDVWSKKLDELIAENTKITDKITLYTGRDGFSKHYTTKKYNVEEKNFGLEHLSASESREEIQSSIGATKDWRRGVIYSSANRFPTSYQAVDIAILKPALTKSETTEILLGRKPEEPGYRFVGGMVDPEDGSLEFAAQREAREETGGQLELGGFEYVTSIRVSDWRYVKGNDKIMTALFKCVHVFGRAQGSDDISEVKWFKIDEITENMLEPEHWKLFKLLLENLKK